MTGEYWLRTDPERPSRSEYAQEWMWARTSVATCTQCGQQILIEDHVVRTDCPCGNLGRRVSKV